MLDPALRQSFHRSMVLLRCGRGVHVVATWVRAWEIRAPWRMWVVCCIVDRAKAFVPEHALPLVGICSVRALHELEIVIMRAFHQVVECVIQTRVGSPNECRCAHIRPVKDEYACSKWNLCRRKTRQWNFHWT
jgi:hypothetical protein